MVCIRRFTILLKKQKALENQGLFGTSWGNRTLNLPLGEGLLQHNDLIPSALKPLFYAGFRHLSIDVDTTILSPK